MDPIILIILTALILLFLPLSLAGIFFNKQDYDDSRVILPK